MLLSSECVDTFSLDEIPDWLRAAGFGDVRTADVPGIAPRIILATKPAFGVSIAK